MITPEDLAVRFNYHSPPNPAVIEAHKVVRDSCARAAANILGNTPGCREQSLAVTKLEEAMYWANAAIARNHDHYTPTEALEGVD